MAERRKSRKRKDVSIAYGQALSDRGFALERVATIVVAEPRSARPSLLRARARAHTIAAQLA
jgi:hypothetical protein